MLSLHNQSQGCVIVALFGIEYKKTLWQLCADSDNYTNGGKHSVRPTSYTVG